MKICNLCEKVITEKRNYVQVEFRKRNTIAKGRVNGVFETYMLHVGCAEQYQRIMTTFEDPHKLEALVNSYKAAEERKEKQE